MNMRTFTCPNCGANISAEAGVTRAVCQFCGTSFAVDDGRVRMDPNNMEEAGYRFEKGRQKAAYEQTRAAQTPPPVQTAKPKKKGRGFKGLLVTVLIILVARAVGYGVGSLMARDMKKTTSTTKTTATAKPSSPADNISNTVANLQDVITLHTTLCKDEGDGLRDYYTFYYGSDTKHLVGWTMELVGEKTAGYTVDGLKSVNLEQYYPAFAEFAYYDELDRVSFVGKMTELDQLDRVQALADHDLIEKFAPDEELRPLDAEYLMNSLRNLGWTDSPVLDISKLHLN